MTPEQYQRLSELFALGSDMEGAQRSEFLAACRRSDPQLHVELTRLLSHDDPRGLAAPDECPPDTGPRSSPPPLPKIPGYSVGQLLGEGGMGQVWHAIQSGTRREVALKVIHGMRFTSLSTRLRFEREVELTAQLSHPHIARVFDSGFAEGYAYYAMEFVPGMSLDAYIRQANPDESARVVLMRSICRAVQHAHQRGVIHRDLKPSNILISSDARPVVVDFGLAKSLDAIDGDSSHITQGILLGTPAYMSPEQAAGHAMRVDTRSDVYSLGVILYWLLTNQLPHDVSGSTLTTIQLVATQDIVPPLQVRPTLDRGLAAILTKSLQHHANDRYSTAGELADDLQRHLDGEPVMANAEQWWYVLRRRLRKHRRAAAIATFLLLFLLAGIAGFAAMSNRHAHIALELAKRAEQARELATRAEQAAVKTAYVHSLGLASRESSLYHFRQASRILEACPSELRGWEWQLLRNRSAPKDSSDVIIGPIDDRIRAMAFSADGRYLAVATGRVTTVATPNPVIYLCDAATGKVQRELRGHTDGIYALSFTPDGHHILAGGRDQTLRRWDVDSGDLEESVSQINLAGQILDHPALFAIRFSPNGKEVAFAVYPHGLCLAHVPEDVTWGSILAHARWVQAMAGEDDFLAFTPDSQKLAWCTRLWQGNVGHILLVDSASQQVLAHQTRPAGSPANSLDFDASGSRLIAGDWRETLTLYSADLNEVQGIFTSHEGSVRSAFFTADSQHILALGPQGMIRKWNQLTRQTQAVLYPAENQTSMAMTLSGDRQHLAVATGPPNLVRIWHLDQLAAKADEVADHAPKARDVALSSDGRWLATAGDDGTVQLRSWPDRVLQWQQRGPHPNATAVAFRDSAVLALGWSAHPDTQAGPPYGQISVVDVPTGNPLASPVTVRGWIWKLDFDSSGEQLIVADGVSPESPPPRQGSGSLIDWNQGSVEWRVELSDLRCRSAMLSPSAKWLITASEQTITVWDRASGQSIAEHRANHGRNFVRLVDEGTAILTGNEGALEIRELPSLQLRSTWQPTSGDPRSRSVVGDAVVHPSGLIASGSWDGTLTLWDAPSQSPLLVMPAHEVGVHRLHFSPDGTTLFSAGHDGKVRVWSSQSPASSPTSEANSLAPVRR